MILLGDCLERLKDLEANSVDAVVTDPPYGWRFMGKAWDGADIEKVAKAKERGGVMADGRTRKPRDLPAESAGTYDQTIKGNHAFEIWTHEYAKELYRVLKPGGHMLVFCGPRTYHRMASGVEDAGFEIRDQLQWLFGSGFPKSHNIGNGVGTALKPANEPIVLARKPLEKGLTVAQNMFRWGVGGLNIDESRVASGQDYQNTARVNPRSTLGGFGSESIHAAFQPAQGRWPANLLLDERAAEMLDEQSGTLKSGDHNNSEMGAKMGYSGGTSNFISNRKGDAGGASRFFYVAKASKRERNAGLEGMAEKALLDFKGKRLECLNCGKRTMIGSTFACGCESPNPQWIEETKQIRGANQNSHPTVKPLKLMEYLCKLITPAGGTILDPFMGSGSTGVAAFRLGFKFIGIEMSEEYVAIATKRIEHAGNE